MKTKLYDRQAAAAFGAREEHEILVDLEKEADRIDALTKELGDVAKSYCDHGAEMTRALTRSAKTNVLFERGRLSDMIAKRVRDSVGGIPGGAPVRRELTRFVSVHEVSARPAKKAV